MLAFDPMKAHLYSVRMHASLENRHISGAERLVGKEGVEEAAASLVRRALDHAQGSAESIRLSVDLVDPDQVHFGCLPDVHTFDAPDVESARKKALQLLLLAGVSEDAVRSAMENLVAGAAPGGGNMRGAMLIGHRSGARFEPDRAKGVRARHMDYSPKGRAELDAALCDQGIGGDRLRDALVLAAKVMAAPGVLAELCWSDDPDYTTGYVAAPQLGYNRIAPLKTRGDERGGRAFFIDEDRRQPEALLRYLRHAVFVADSIGRIFPPERFKQ
ncbi:6-carboxyhexanoate--CoA ligase [Geoalkalibacter subterraneus]|uniref:6-carboxyhexanoate--CoA ligase n=1 Tax=Geoalkalibacter subterraneus TaxID=483547 RepID=UPI0009FFA3E9|nr:6-carboxyhexanoate--CoA ligase [Geoalkalibacter subterraneus]